MKQIQFSVLCLIAAVLPGIRGASGQVINASMQNAAPRVVTSRGAPAAKPIVNMAIAPYVAARPTGFSPRIINLAAPQVVPPSAPNLQRTYSPAMPGSNATLATLNAQSSAPEQQPISLDPGTRQAELRTMATMRQRRGLVTGQANTLNPMRQRSGFGTYNQTLATINAQRNVVANNPPPGSQPDTRKPLKDAQVKKWRNKHDQISYDDAFHRHWHEWHDRNWWHNHCDTIVFVSTGYYFLDGSYWYPAYGYDPLQSYYDYDGPVYTYGDLLPDEVIANVQTALQGAGYYVGSITGSLSIDTRAALANFQRDYGLQITGAIDEATVEALGLNQTDNANNFQTDQGY